MNQWFPTFQKIQQTPLRDLLRLHVSGRLNWQARIDASNLPETAKKKIADVIKATRLWRLEKSQIADELIAHFTDGQERGKDVGAMVASFGDATTVAPLMRAAKKRNRSWAWKALVASGYAFLGFLIFYAGVAVWFFSGQPNPTIDYFAVVAAPARAVPVEERAWPIYREAWIEHNFVNLSIAKHVGQEKNESWNRWRPGDEKWPRVVAFLGEHESLVSAIREGGQKSGLGHEIKVTSNYSPEDQLAMFGSDYHSNESDDPKDGLSALMDDSLIRSLLPHIQEMRKMVRILQTDVFRMAEAGEAKLATEGFLAMLGLAPQAAETPFLVSSLVGLAIDGIAYRTLDEFLARYPDLLTDQQLAQIAEKVTSLSPRDLVKYDGERAFQKDMVQRMYSDDGAGDGRLTNEGIAAVQSILDMTTDETNRERPSHQLLNIVGPGVALVSGSRKQLEQAIDGILDEAVAWAPFYEQSARGSIEFDDLLAKYAPNDPAARTFLGMMMPAMEQVNVAGERTECKRNAALLALATHRYRLKHGHFPESADELVPAFMESIPMDVLNGDLLNYRLSDGKPLIYSVGADLDDDGGVEAVDPFGRPADDPTLHFDTAKNVYQLEGDWILWPHK